MEASQPGTRAGSLRRVDFISRLHGNFSARLAGLVRGNRGKFDFKMARNANVILSTFGLVTVQLAVYMTMVMQLHGLIFLWKIFEKQRSNAIVAWIQRKRSYYLRKMKQARLRRLRRKNVVVGLVLVEPSNGG